MYTKAAHQDSKSDLPLNSISLKLNNRMTFYKAEASRAKQLSLALKEDGSMEEEAVEDTAVVPRPPKRPRTRSIAANEACKSTGILLSMNLHDQKLCYAIYSFLFCKTKTENIVRVERIELGFILHLCRYFVITSTRL